MQPCGHVSATGHTLRALPLQRFRTVDVFLDGLFAGVFGLVWQVFLLRFSSGMDLLR